MKMKRVAQLQRDIHGVAPVGIGIGQAGLTGAVVAIVIRVARLATDDATITGSSPEFPIPPQINLITKNPN